MIAQEEPAQSRRDRLNRIAQHRTRHDELPADSSWEDVAEHAEALYDDLEALIRAYETDTTLTPVEAETWVLRNTDDDEGIVLSNDGVALVLAAPNGPFQANGMNETTMTVSDVEQDLLRASGKIEQARRLVMLNECPEYEQALDTPSVVVLDAATKRRLKRNATPDDELLNDVVARKLDETETRRSLESFAEQFLETVGRDAVGQMTVDEQSLRSGLLVLTVHGRELHDMPSVVTETDAITVADRRYDVHVESDPYWPTSQDRITLYGVDPGGLQPDVDTTHVALADGVEAVRSAVTDLLQQGDASDPAPW